MQENTVLELAIKENEELVYPFIWINGKEKEITIKIDLIGANSSVLLYGIFLGGDNRQIVFNTDVVHSGKNTRSRIHLRAVFFDESSFSNDGMIRILKGAKNADGFFASKVLLFDSAKGRSVPSLEIDENEVKAGHGSTIGRPDPRQLFYMRSRGLTEKEAESLIVEGFFDPVVRLLPIKQRRVTNMQIAKFLRNKLLFTNERCAEYEGL
jgi:Fe-S cluster assembly protein SufD